MIDFAAALDQPANSIEKPPALPQGNYVWSVTKIPTQSQTSSGEWNIVEFTIVPVEATDDVDPEELEAFGSLRSGINRLPFMFPTDPSKEADVKKGLYRLKQFMLKTLKVDLPEDESLRAFMDASVNCQFIGQAVWRMVEGETYVDVKNTVALD